MLLGASWMHLGRLMGALGRFLRTLGPFSLDLGRILLTFWVVWASKMGSWALGVSGTDLGGPRTPIWEDLASILSKLFHFIRFHAHHSISFQPHSIPFYPFHSIPFKKHKALKLQVGRASEPSRFRASWLPDASRPRRDSRSVNNLFTAIRRRPHWWMRGPRRGQPTNHSVN